MRRRRAVRAGPRRARPRELRGDGVQLTLHDDLTLVPHEAVAARDGSPCRTYSAYARAVGRVLRAPADAPERSRPRRPAARARPARGRLPDADELGLARRGPDLRGGETAGARAPARAGATARSADYARTATTSPTTAATSRLSPYLKLGMLSPRRCLAAAERAGAAKWLAELLWRDWFKYVLHHHPDLAERSVDPRFARPRVAGHGRATSRPGARGETGYGLVDAGMRQLASTG